ncbi:MAG: YwiC-like family protein [Acidimicrobiales bacterium]
MTSVEDGLPTGSTPRPGSGGRSPAGTTPRPMSRLRQVAVPTEHGGWSLTAEPVILALLVVPSWSGLALGLAAVMAFLARTPMKVVLVDRWRRRWLDRTRLAAVVAAVEVAVIVILAVLAASTAVDGRFWLPLAAAVPLVAVEAWFDMRSRSRRLVPELAGAVGISSVAAAIVVAGGGSMTVAAGLWAVMAARATAAIPFARVQVARVHHRPVELWTSDVAQLMAVAVAVAAWTAGAVPFAPVVVVAAIAVVNTVSVRGPVRPAVVVGVQQTVYGLVTVLVTAGAMALGA